MTAREKARELINKYNLVVLDTALGGSNMRVKKCALIAVDEIIKEVYNASYKIGRNGLSHQEYWQEVKEEIQKL